MPDYGLLAASVMMSAVAAGGAFFLIVRMRREAAIQWRRMAWIWSLGLVMYAGCGLLGEWPRWPPTEDRDRLLTVLLPLTLVVETAAAGLRSRAFAWGLRCLLAASVGPILLFNTSYLADLAGPNSAEWEPHRAAAILLLLGAALAGTWASLARLSSTELAGAMAPSLAIVALCAGATVMLTGYFRGGTLGLPLAGSIAGAAIAWRLTPNGTHAAPDVGVQVVLLFAILILGRFFGSTPTSSSIILFLSPLLNWFALIPSIRNLKRQWRLVVQWSIAIVPPLAILILAQIKFSSAFG